MLLTIWFLKKIKDFITRFCIAKGIMRLHYVR